MFRILILGASYGSLFGTKCAMAGQDVTLVCRPATADLINREGTEVRLKLKGDATHRAIKSRDLAGSVRAASPQDVEPAADLVVLAMQEPQYADPAIRALMSRIAEARIPCLSLMNIAPLPYLRRISGINTALLQDAFTSPRAWERFDPKAMTLCSPDPQALRPDSAAANVLQVNLATNFKAAEFDAPEHNTVLNALAEDIENVRLDGLDVPVKLKVSPSLFVPLAKWPMVITGNYRCVTGGNPIAIRDAVLTDPELSREIYAFVTSLVMRLGGTADDLVPFDKYATAAEQLTRPSSVARALAAGAPTVERVDKLIQLIGRQHGMSHPVVDQIVARVDADLETNRTRAA